MIEKKIKDVRAKLLSYTFFSAPTVVEIVEEEGGIRPVRVKTWTDGDGIYRRNAGLCEDLRFEAVPGHPIYTMSGRVVKDSSNNMYAERHGHCNNYFNWLVEYQKVDEPVTEKYQHGEYSMYFLRPIYYGGKEYSSYKYVPSCNLLYKGVLPITVRMDEEYLHEYQKEIAREYRDQAALLHGRVSETPPEGRERLVEQLKRAFDALVEGEERLERERYRRYTLFMQTYGRMPVREEWGTLTQLYERVPEDAPTRDGVFSVFGVDYVEDGQVKCDMLRFRRIVHA